MAVCVGGVGGSVARAGLPVGSGDLHPAVLPLNVPYAAPCPLLCSCDNVFNPVTNRKVRGNAALCTMAVLLVCVLLERSGGH